MTTGLFKHIDPATISGSNETFVKPWSKVDVDKTSFKQTERKRSVADLHKAATANATAIENANGNVASPLSTPLTFGTDLSGFALYESSSTEKAFVDDGAVRGGYYAEVEALLRSKLPRVKKVVIFDHTIRRRDENSPRQPVQQVHVDQTPWAAEARVRRHTDPSETEALLQGRYQIINVWRPIAHPASDYPLALIDWRTTRPDDLVAIDLLYPKRNVASSGHNDKDGDDKDIVGKGDEDDDRGKEKLPDKASLDSTDGYEPKGETYAVAPSENHKFYYVKDMTPDEVLLIKCFDSRSQGLPGGIDGLAGLTPHTAFVDPETPADAKPRQSIEVRCLVFYD